MASEIDRIRVHMKPIGGQVASQHAALRRLVEYLRLAEESKWPELMRTIDDDAVSGECHPNAVVLEACIMLTSIRNGTGRSMAGYAFRLLQDFGKRAVRGAVNGRIWLPH